MKKGKLTSGRCFVGTWVGGFSRQTLNVRNGAIRKLDTSSEHPSRTSSLALSEVGFLRNFWLQSLMTTGALFRNSSVSDEDNSARAVGSAITLSGHGSGLELKFVGLVSGSDAFREKRSGS